VCSKLDHCVVPNEVEPKILNASLDGGLFKRGDLVQVSFDVVKPLRRDPIVELLQEPSRVRQLEKIKMTPLDAGFSFVYSHLIDGDDVDGEATVWVRLLSPSDVEGESKFPVVQFDLTPPTVFPNSASVSLSRPSDCPSEFAVAAVNAQSAATVRFNVTEALAEAPTVTLLNGSKSALTKVSEFGFGFVYSYVPSDADAGSEEGTFKVQVGLRDRANNSSTSTLENVSITVDFSPPQAPNVNGENAWVLVRAPFGNQTREAFFELQVSEAVPSETTVRVLPVALPGEIARHTFDGGTGSVVIPLQMTDQKTVALEMRDSACNASPKVNVRDVTWIATHAGRSPTDALTNPHEVFVKPWFANEASKQNGFELPAAISIARVDSMKNSIDGLPSWFSGVSSDSHNVSNDASAVYDSLRKRVLAAGGNVYGGRSGASSEWNGIAWSLAYRDDSAEKNAFFGDRSKAAMSYDERRHRAVLYGGLINGDPRGLFEWDGVTWARVGGPQTLRPGQRKSAAMAYDSIRSQSVLFGGQISSESERFQTWAWNGATFSLLADAGPSPRALHAMVYDKARDKIVLFGGQLASGGVAGDTWELSGNTWQQLPIAGPPARAGHALAYSNDTQRTLLFGGHNDAGIRLNDTWEFNGMQWRNTTPDAGVNPPPLTGANMVYNSDTKKTVLMLGESSNFFASALGPCKQFPLPSDAGCYTVWEWNGASWSDRTPPQIAYYQRNPNLPPGAGAAAMAFDSNHGRTFVAGGVNTSFDLWSWNGTTWRSHDAGAMMPPSRLYHSMTYNTAEDRLVVFGGLPVQFDPIGSPAATWDWTENTGWTVDLSASDAGPNRRYKTGLVYDPYANRAVLAGGEWAQNETWIRTGSGPWIQDSRSPSSDVASALVIDTVTKRPLMLTRNQLFAETDAGWTLVSPQQPLSNAGAFLEGVFYFDTNRKTPWFFASSTQGDTRLLLQEFVNGEWKVINTPNPKPTSKGQHSGAYDSSRNRFVLFGLQYPNGGGNIQETWELGLDTRYRPAQVSTFRFSSAVPEGSELKSMRVRSAATGFGFDGTQRVNGVALWLWRRNAFAIENTLVTDGGIEFSSSTASDLSEWISDQNNEIKLVLSPTEANGNQPAHLEVDSLELEVRYRRP
jgi:hypothetical protein